MTLRQLLREVSHLSNLDDELFIEIIIRDSKQLGTHYQTIPIVGYLHRSKKSPSLLIEAKDIVKAKKRKYG